jgi:hypothetical protein
MALPASKQVGAVLTVLAVALLGVLTSPATAKHAHGKKKGTPVEAIVTITDELSIDKTVDDTFQHASCTNPQCMSGSDDEEVHVSYVTTDSDVRIPLTRQKKQFLEIAQGPVKLSDDSWKWEVEDPAGADCGTSGSFTCDGSINPGHGILGIAAKGDKIHLSAADLQFTPLNNNFCTDDIGMTHDPAQIMSYYTTPGNKLNTAFLSDLVRWEGHDHPPYFRKDEVAVFTPGQREAPEPINNCSVPDSPGDGYRHDQCSQTGLLHSVVVRLRVDRLVYRNHH